MKLAYDLVAKARVFFRLTFSFSAYPTLSTDLVELVARHCKQQYKVKYNIVEELLSTFSADMNRSVKCSIDFFNRSSGLRTSSGICG